jgi:hypothetical protein
MRVMKRFILPSLFAALLVTALATDAPLNQLTETEKAAGWKLLFDGKDATQWWRGYNKDKLPDEWKVEDGALVRHGGGDIVTKDQYENFELSIEWKISEGGNSGIMFKVQETDGPPYATGPEAQLQDNVKGHDPQKAGWLYQFYKTEKDATKPVGEWNQFRLVCNHNKCEHWMNGVKYFDYEIGSADWNEKLAKSKFASMPGFAKAAKGYICLQDHGNEVAFRNIKIRVLP